MDVGVIVYCLWGEIFNWVAKGDMSLLSSSQPHVVKPKPGIVRKLDASLGIPLPMPCPSPDGDEGLPEDCNIVYVQVWSVTPSSEGSLTNRHDGDQPLLSRIRCA